MIRFLIIALTALIALFGVTQAFAQSFNIDLDIAGCDPALGCGVPSDLFPGAAGQPGRWNRIYAAGLGRYSLVDIEGRPTDVVLEALYDAPSELCFRLEAHASERNLRQTIELYDWDHAIWVVMDTRPVTTAPAPPAEADSVVEATVVCDPNKFVQANTRLVRAKVSYQQTGPVFNNAWQARIDQTVWHILAP